MTLRVLTIVLTVAALAGLDRADSGDGTTWPPRADVGPAGLRLWRRRLDLNRASEGDLAGLPGVGPGRAAAIVRTRAELGRFTEVDDLLHVPGIGEKTLERLRAQVRVGDDN
jgi:competence ComEA-like helix-hairpin-helix protein